MKRRAMLAGTGMLLTGSGIIGTSAAFGSSVTAASSFRVITAKNLRVRAGQAFAADGSVNEGYEDRFVAYEETADSMFFDNAGGLNNISKEDIPVATVNPRDKNNNEELVLESAISVNSDGVVFEDILEIQNLGTSTESVGISYDRDKNQYGDDVNVGGGDDTLNDLDVQSVYRFIDKNGNRISPDQDTLGSSVDNPAAFVEIEPNEIHPIDLKIDFSEYGNRFIDGTPKENILQVAQLGGPFEGSTDTVDLLDSITVGTEDT